MHSHLRASKLHRLSHGQAITLIAAFERYLRERGRRILTKPEVEKVLGEAKDTLAKELLHALTGWLTGRASLPQPGVRARVHRLVRSPLLQTLRVWSRLDQEGSESPPLYVAVPPNAQQELATELGLPVSDVSDWMRTQLHIWLRTRTHTGAETVEDRRLQILRARLLVLLAAWHQVHQVQQRPPSLFELLPRLEPHERLRVEDELLAAQYGVTQTLAAEARAWISRHPDHYLSKELQKTIRPRTLLKRLVRQWDAVDGRSVITGRCEARLFALLSFVHDELGGGRVEVRSCAHDGCLLEKSAEQPGGPAKRPERVEIVGLQVLLELGPDASLASAARLLHQSPRLSLEQLHERANPAATGSSLCTLRVRAVCASSRNPRDRYTATASSPPMQLSTLEEHFKLPSGADTNELLEKCRERVEQALRQARTNRESLPGCDAPDHCVKLGKRDGRAKTRAMTCRLAQLLLNMVICPLHGLVYEYDEHQTEECQHAEHPEAVANVAAEHVGPEPVARPSTGCYKYLVLVPVWRSLQALSRQPSGRPKRSPGVYLEVLYQTPSDEALIAKLYEKLRTWDARRDRSDFRQLKNSLAQTASQLIHPGWVPRSVDPAQYSTYVLAAVLAASEQGHADREKALRALRRLEGDAGLGLRCVVLLALTLDEKLAKTGRSPGQRVDEQTLRACWEHLGPEPPASGACLSTPPAELQATCSDHPHLSILAYSLPAGREADNEPTTVARAHEVYQALCQHDKLPRCMVGAISEYLMQKLLARISQDLSFWLWDAYDDESEPSPGASRSNVEDPASGSTLSARYNMLLAEIDEVVAKVLDERRKHADSSAKEAPSEWDKVIEVVVKTVRAGLPKSRPPAAEPGQGAATRPAGGASRGGAAVLATPAEQVAARLQELLPRAASAIIKGQSSAASLTADLIALEISRLLLQYGARLFPSKLRYALSFHRIQGAQVIGPHLQLFRNLFVTPAHWILYRLACQLDADEDFENGEPGIARVGSALAVWDFLLNWPYDFAASFKYLTDRGCTPIHAEQASRQLGGRAVTELNLKELVELGFALGRRQHIERRGQGGAQ
jgi:hypothetical protein